MVFAKDLRAGTHFILEGKIFRVLNYQIAKTAQSKAIVRVKVQNLETGAVLEKSFKSEDQVESAYVETKPLEYLYHDGDGYHFMDQQTYEQIAIPEELLGDNTGFMKENMVANIIFYEDRPLGIELPPSVELRVVETEPGFKGDTVSGASKPARLETGRTINVPLFVEAGDLIKVDTRYGKYLERA
jgi:elongation factor P